MVAAPVSDVNWSHYHRLINSAYPPIDLFEDIADPADWELLAASESKTNPRVSSTIGQLDKVPVDRRVSGPGASYVTAPFVHASSDRAGRFHDGEFGALYVGDSFETALFETVHHIAVFCSATKEEPGWIADMREVVGQIEAKLHDIRGDEFADLLLDNRYSASQGFAREVIAAGGDGIIYPSVRNPGGECVAAFYPDVVGIPIQGRHFSYHWDGERVDLIKDLSDEHNVYVIKD